MTLLDRERTARTHAHQRDVPAGVRAGPQPRDGRGRPADRPRPARHPALGDRLCRERHLRHHHRRPRQGAGPQLADARGHDRAAAGLARAAAAERAVHAAARRVGAAQLRGHAAAAARRRAFRLDPHRRLDRADLGRPQGRRSNPIAIVAGARDRPRHRRVVADGAPVPAADPRAAERHRPPRPGRGRRAVSTCPTRTSRTSAPRSTRSASRCRRSARSWSSRRGVPSRWSSGSRTPWPSSAPMATWRSSTPR